MDPTHAWGVLGTLGLASSVLVAYERQTILAERHLLAEERKVLCEERAAVMQERGRVILASATPQVSRSATVPVVLTPTEPDAAAAKAEAAPSHNVTSYGVTASLRSSSSSTKTLYPPVVISYQSAQFELMVRLRDRLEAIGIQTIDGSRTPAGKDWRKFYFTALSRATVFLPILSDNYLASRACEVLNRRHLRPSINVSLPAWP
jgi:hypothetical protein